MRSIIISDSELRKEFTRLRNSDEYVWLQKVSNNVTKQAIKDACNAYKNFFKGLQKYPRFKSKKKSMPKFYQDNIKIQFQIPISIRTSTKVRVEIDMPNLFYTYSLRWKFTERGCN